MAIHIAVLDILLFAFSDCVSSWKANETIYEISLASLAAGVVPGVVPTPVLKPYFTDAENNYGLDPIPNQTFVPTWAGTIIPEWNGTFYIAPEGGLLGTTNPLVYLEYEDWTNALSCLQQYPYTLNECWTVLELDSWLGLSAARTNPSDL